MAAPTLLPALRRHRDRAATWAAEDEYAAVKLVVGVTVVSLLLRLVALGHRVAHYDEGRVAYWALYFADEGSFAYRRIVHGPFIQHVDSWLFPMLGATDVTMRLPLAVVGGLLPLTALLFRAHLRRSEIVATALFLALNPVLLYYSRFMRSDVLVAAFMFTAFGFLVRFYDTRNPWYFYGIATFVAFGFASKENAIVYVLTWLGATGLLVAKGLVLPNGYREAGRFLWSGPSLSAIWRRIVGRVRANVRGGIDILRSFRQRHDSAAAVLGLYAFHLAFAAVLFGAISLYFFAARGDAMSVTYPAGAISREPTTLSQGLSDPTLFWQLVHDTAVHAGEGYTAWFDPASEKATTESTSLRAAVSGFVEEYDHYYGAMLRPLAFASAPLLSFGVFGYVLDRLGVVRARHLIPFAAYCGFVSIVGYPIGMDIPAPWPAVHVLVPLSIPAGVGVAAVFRWGLDSLSVDDVTGVAITGLVLLLLVALVANVAATNVYDNAHADENPLVQYAQPQESLRGDLDEMDRIATASNGSTDVLVYHGETGEEYDTNNAYVEEDEGSWDRPDHPWQPSCIQWHNTLPMPWYFAASDAAVSCENGPAALSARLQTSPPPIVITQQYDTTVPRDRLERAGYEPRTHRMRTSGYKNVFTVWIHEEYAPDERPTTSFQN